MTSLELLPNELSYAIISSLEIEDVISLSRTSRRLYQYVFSDQVSRAVAQVSDVPYASFAMFADHSLKRPKSH